MKRIISVALVLMVAAVLAVRWTPGGHKPKSQPVPLPAGIESVEQWEARINREDDTLPVDEFNRRQHAKRRNAKRNGRAGKMPIDYGIADYTVTSPTNIKDGDNATNTQFNLDAYVLLDLGAVVNVTSIVTTGVLSGPPSQLNYYASDAGGAEGAELGNVVDFGPGTITLSPAVATRYIKAVGMNAAPISIGEIQINGTAARAGHIRIGLASGDVLGANFSDDASVTSGANYSADTQNEGWFQHVQITILNPPATGFVTSVAGDYWEKGSETIGHAVKQNQVFGLNSAPLIVDEDTGEIYRLKVSDGAIGIELVS